jgi:hypothetical protein
VDVVLGGSRNRFEAATGVQLPASAYVDAFDQYFFFFFSFNSSSFRTMTLSSVPSHSLFKCKTKEFWLGHLLSMIALHVTAPIKLS